MILILIARTNINFDFIMCSSKTSFTKFVSMWEQITCRKKLCQIQIFIWQRKIHNKFQKSTIKKIYFKVVLKSIDTNCEHISEVIKNENDDNYEINRLYMFF